MGSSSYFNFCFFGASIISIPLFHKRLGCCDILLISSDCVGGKETSFHLEETNRKNTPLTVENSHWIKFKYQCQSIDLSNHKGVIYRFLMILDIFVIQIPIIKFATKNPTVPKLHLGTSRCCKRLGCVWVEAWRPRRQGFPEKKRWGGNDLFGVESWTIKAPILTLNWLFKYNYIA